MGIQPRIGQRRSAVLADPRATVPAVRRCGILGAALAVMVATLAPSSLALAAGPVTHVLTGTESVVACGSASLCIAGGESAKGVGVVIALHDGAEGHVSTLAGTERVDAVSCGTATSCVALATPTDGANASFASIDAAGVVTATHHVTLTPGYDLTRLACVGATCEVAGVDVFSSPESLVLGEWNGHAVTLHRVAVPGTLSDPTLEGLACSGASCVAVGDAYKHVSTVVGLVLTFASNAGFKLHTDADHSLTGVACVSAARCYAAGYDVSGGVVDTLTSGTATRSVALSHDDLFGISCRPTACTAVGETLSNGAGYWGTIVPVVGGTPGTDTVVDASGGFNGVASSGSTYVAIGPTQTTGSLTATG